MTNCVNCNKEFEAKRTDARFCSDKCRKFCKRHVRDNSDVGEGQKTWMPNWQRAGYKSKEEIEKVLLGIIEQFPTCKWLYKGYVIKLQ